MILKFHEYELQGTSEEIANFVTKYETKIEIIKGKIDYNIGDTISVENKLEEIPLYKKGGYTNYGGITLVGAMDDVREIEMMISQSLLPNNTKCSLIGHRHKAKDCPERV